MATAGHAHGLSQDSTWGQFSSYHPGIVQFCLADGSVREVALTIDSTPQTDANGVIYTLLDLLGAIADGVTINDKSW